MVDPLQTIANSSPIRFWRRFAAAGPGVLAAAVAFNLFFALVPAAITLVMAASFFGRNAEAKEQMVDFLEQVLPADTASSISDALAVAWASVEGAHGVVVVVSLVVSVWAASRGVNTIMRVLARIERMTDGRAWWRRRLVAIALSLGAGGMLLLTVVLIVAGAGVAEWLAQLTDIEWIVTAWERLSLPVGALGLFAFLTALYRWGPPQRLPGFWIAAGFGAVGTITVSLGFRLFFENSGGLGVTFQAFATVAVLLLWLLLMSYVIILSAAFGASVSRGWVKRRANGNGTAELSLGLETMESEIADFRR
ncbi:MAG TPA: YihY/virulence factor BrkB family protein [Acidimicrobiia bacterium]|nr:YihY/virulence factor BrkB family protein [Acidimicrobiia bacterium]